MSSLDVSTVLIMYIIYNTLLHTLYLSLNILYSSNTVTHGILYSPRFTIDQITYEFESSDPLGINPYQSRNWFDWVPIREN